MDPRSFLVVLMSLSVASAGAVAPTIGDAGTGSDAGDEPANATSIKAGTYNGTLFPPGDADWYELSTSPMQPLCSEAIVTGAVHADVVLSSTPGLNPNVTRPARPSLSLDLGLSTPSTSGFFLGLQSPETSSPAETAVGSYQFQIRTFGLGETGPGDDGTGEDAGDDRATAITTEGPCVGGSLSDSSDSDVYVFNATEGEHVALSLSQATSAPTFVNLTTPSGERLAQIDAGEFADVTLNETGEWLVRVDVPDHASITNGDYLLGLTVNGPEPQPCKPTCMFYTR